MLLALFKQTTPSHAALWQGFWDVFDQKLRFSPNKDEFSKELRKLLINLGLDRVQIAQLFKANGPSATLLEELEQLVESSEVDVNGRALAQIATYIYRTPKHLISLEVPAHHEVIRLKGDRPPIKKWELLYDAPISIWKAAIKTGLIVSEEIPRIIEYKNKYISKHQIHPKYFAEVSALEELDLSANKVPSKEEIAETFEPGDYHDYCEWVKALFITRFSLPTHLLVLAQGLHYGSIYAKGNLANPGTMDATDDKAGSASLRAVTRFFYVYVGIPDQYRQASESTVSVISSTGLEALALDLDNHLHRNCSGMIEQGRVHSILASNAQLEALAEIRLLAPEIKEISTEVVAPIPSTSSLIDQVRHIQTALMGTGRRDGMTSAEKDIIVKYIKSILEDKTPAKAKRLHNDLYAEGNKVQLQAVLEVMAIAIRGEGYEKWVKSCDDFRLLNSALNGLDDELHQWVASQAVFEINTEDEFFQLVSTLGNAKRVKQFINRNTSALAVLPRLLRFTENMGGRDISDRVRDHSKKEVFEEVCYGSIYVNKVLFILENFINRRNFIYQDPSDENKKLSAVIFRVPTSIPISEFNTSERNALFDMAKKYKDAAYMEKYYEPIFHVDMDFCSPVVLDKIMDDDNAIRKVSSDDVINLFKKNSEIPADKKKLFFDKWALINERKEVFRVASIIGYEEKFRQLYHESYRIDFYSCDLNIFKGLLSNFKFEEKINEEIRLYIKAENRNKADIYHDADRKKTYILKFIIVRLDEIIRGLNETERNSFFDDLSGFLNEEPLRNSLEAKKLYHKNYTEIYFYDRVIAYRVLNKIFTDGLDGLGNDKQDYLTRLRDYFLTDKVTKKTTEQKKFEMVSFLIGILALSETDNIGLNYLRIHRPVTFLGSEFTLKNGITKSFIEAVVIILTELKRYDLSLEEVNLVSEAFKRVLPEIKRQSDSYYNRVCDCIYNIKLSKETRSKILGHYNDDTSISRHNAVSSLVSFLNDFDYTERSNKNSILSERFIYDDGVEVLIKSSLGLAEFDLMLTKPRFLVLDVVHLSLYAKIKNMTVRDFEEIIVALKRVRNQPGLMNQHRMPILSSMGITTPSAVDKINRIIDGLLYVYNEFGKDCVDPTLTQTPALAPAPAALANVPVVV